MLSRQQILALIPHQGTMCLLDTVTAWSADGIVCRALSHLSPDNPLRRDGRLRAICGIEYGLQGAALHGALLAGGNAASHRAASGADCETRGNDGGDRPPAARPGFVAALRAVTLHADHLDNPAFGTLCVMATLELHAGSGSIYRFAVASESGAPLLDGRGTIAFAKPAA